MANILVTGANGQLGKSLRRVANTYPYSVKDFKWFWTDKVNEGARALESFSVADLDISADKESIKQYVEKNHIDIIVNCAAFTNVDAAEGGSAAVIAALVNTNGVKLLAEVAAEKDIMLIHISTDYVFGGGEKIFNTPCNESTPCAPLGVYGKTKLAGENWIKKAGCKKHVIIRTSWLYSEYGKNFCKTMMNVLAGDKLFVRVVNDQTGTPTYAGDLAKAILDIIETYDTYPGGGASMKDRYGIYHYSNEGACTWYDFTCMIAYFMGAKKYIEPIKSDEYPSPVKRPAYSVLDKSKIKKRFNVEVPFWVESLEKCVENLKTNDY